MPSNPFSTRFVRPGAIPFRFPGGISAEAESSRIATAICGSPASLIAGPHGSGKTTLLHGLRSHLACQTRQLASILLHSPSTAGIRARMLNHQRNFRRVLDCQRTLPPDGLLIIDGIEQLSGRSRRSLLRRASAGGYRILATSHQPLAGFTTVYHTRVRAEIIQSITSLLTSRTTEGLKKVVASELSRRELSKVTNVRDLLFELYDLVAQQ